MNSFGPFGVLQGLAGQQLGQQSQQASVEHQLQLQHFMATRNAVRQALNEEKEEELEERIDVSYKSWCQMRDSIAKHRAAKERWACIAALMMAVALVEAVLLFAYHFPAK